METVGIDAGGSRAVEQGISGGVEDCGEPEGSSVGAMGTVLTSKGSWQKSVGVLGAPGELEGTGVVSMGSGVIAEVSEQGSGGVLHGLVVIDKAGSIGVGEWEMAGDSEELWVTVWEGRG